ncbi:aldose epimerase family protein [Yinghuangia seranimata]|uniref:aldose epimerase family protein n=1 Tax=Yinghuangia seranimata TaxID=408067 RepID=UPI00248B98E4|nr:aldose epimerase family protein [Yinghuangia seranimata]MDI2125843.1 aldose epimerase family protein [Yinghuangia seranimata]
MSDGVHQQAAPSAAGEPTVRQEPFGSAPDGTPVHRWILENPAGVRVEVISYGAVMRSCRVPDKNGFADDVVLGLPRVLDYAVDDAYLGAVVGRYANRIARGTFTLDAVAYELPRNDRGHTLHGGPDGFHRRVWSGVGFTEPGQAGVRLRLRSPDGDMGFPGRLDAEVTYRLDTAGTLALDYRATADRTTVVNLTHHAYWNLEGRGRDVLRHRLAVAADAYLPVDGEGIPYGPPEPVAGTPFDLRAAAPLGDPVRADHPQTAAAGGLDHCFVLRDGGDEGGDGGSGPALRHAATLTDPASGRTLETWTTEPGLQVYTSNALGAPFAPHAAVCLETQRFPDAPNRPEYPTAALRPGEVHRSTTHYRFTHLST